MNFIHFFLNKIYMKLFPNFWNEKRKQFGNINADKTFYIIRRNDKTVGIYSMFIYVLGHINYALENKWIPAVDMQFYDNAYIDPKHKGQENSWLYFFEQLCPQYDLNEIYRSKNVVISNGNVLKNMPNMSMDFYNNSKTIQYWGNIAHEYIRLTADIKREIQEKYDLLFSKLRGEKVLGVLLRGTDYVALRPAKHPVQPTLTEAISAVREIMDQTHCHFIYLTTEDQQLLDGMKEEFKDSLLYCDVPRYSGKIDRRLNEIRYNEADSYKSKGINYIVPVGVLAKCNYLFAGRTSGSVAVLLMDNCFEGVTVWNNGEYE